jgi:hypothetical protein
MPYNQYINSELQGQYRQDRAHGSRLSGSSKRMEDYYNDYTAQF